MNLKLRSLNRNRYVFEFILKRLVSQSNLLRTKRIYYARHSKSISLLGLEVFRCPQAKEKKSAPICAT